MRFSIILTATVLSPLALGAAIPVLGGRAAANPLEPREANVIGWEKVHKAQDESAPIEERKANVIGWEKVHEPQSEAAPVVARDIADPLEGREAKVIGWEKAHQLPDDEASADVSVAEAS